MTLLNLLSGGQGVSLWVLVQKQTPGENDIQRFMTHRTERRYFAPLQGPHGEVKAECREREGQDLWLMCLWGSVGRVLWAFQAKAKSVNSNPKREFLYAPWGSYLRVAQEKGPGRQARLWKLSAVAEVISGTDICLWLWGCLLERVLAGGASLSLRPYRTHGQTEWTPKQQFHGAA